MPKFEINTGFACEPIYYEIGTVGSVDYIPKIGEIKK